MRHVGEVSSLLTLVLLGSLHQVVSGEADSFFLNLEGPRTCNKGGVFFAKPGWISLKPASACLFSTGKATLACSVAELPFESWLGKKLFLIHCRSQEEEGNSTKGA